MRRFDLLGPLPAHRSTTVLEASAGTGKTFALAGLVTRYLAEGEATLNQMLLITFSRSATQELRERVRAQIVQAVRAFDDPSVIGDNQVVKHLLDGTPEERADRKTRLRDALAGFDAATIATTHQFCHLVLKSLGVAGDGDAGVELVENLDDLVGEIVDDLYLAHFGRDRDDPVLPYQDALRLAREVDEKPRGPIAARRSRPGFPRRGVSSVRHRRSPRTGDPQASTGRPRLRRPADQARRTRWTDEDAPARLRMQPALAGGDGRRVPGHRPGAVEGHRPRLQQLLDSDPHRRPEAGDLRIPGRRHRHLPGGCRNGGRQADAGNQLAQ